MSKVVKLNEYNGFPIIKNNNKKAAAKAVKMFPIADEDGNSLLFQTPLIMTYGVADFVDAATGEGDGKFFLSLQINEDDPQQILFLNKLQEFESKIINSLCENNTLGGNMSLEIIKHSFYSCIKYGKKSPDRNPTIKFRVGKDTNTNAWKIAVFDSEKQLIFDGDTTNKSPSQIVEKFDIVGAVFQPYAIWNTGKSFGISYNAIQVIIKQKNMSNNLPKGVCLL